MCSYPEIMPVSMIGAAARHETALNNDGPISDRRTPNSPAPNRPAPNSPAATTCDTHHVGSCAPVRVRTGSRSMAKWIAGANPCRSEEHTSVLQSRFELVCRLLLENKKM